MRAEKSQVTDGAGLGGGVVGKWRVSLARGGVAGNCRKRGKEPRAGCLLSEHAQYEMLGCSSAQPLDMGSHARPPTSDLKPVPSPP